MFSQAQREAIGIIKSGVIPTKTKSKKFENVSYIFHNVGMKVYVSIIETYQHTASHYAETKKIVDFTFNLDKKRA